MTGTRSEARTTSRHLTGWATETRDEAIGRRWRDDPVRPRTGGPAGNATLTAWTGVVLLALFVAELVTLLDVHGLLSWHVAIGALLVPPALLKTATTGWRIVRYYSGDRDYVRAGPPPTLLRLLGPIVIVSTLAVLGSGLALVLVGEQASRQTLATILGQRIDALTLHQGSFIVWAVATGLHVLARLVPAARIVTSRAGTPPGRGLRALALGVAAALAVITAVLVLRTTGTWGDGRPHGPDTGQTQGGRRASTGPAWAEVASRITEGGR